ncbi:MAG: class I SAM-dependent methyltransferase [Mycobacteriaceae bacterium]|nr:class I SAM-dependent methyltransferase [Mycobacteriaceae bacterium]MBV9639473.1 class I SAM-dependent methyltransferase [Mycobacteriaceae bacterium]
MTHTARHSFSHNDFYHRALLRAVPPGCDRALDIGCGTGLFARKLARQARFVEAVDTAPELIAEARRQSSGLANLTYVQADFSEYVPHPDGYQFVSCLASLHHMPFAQTTAKLRDVLAPGGVLMVLGCYREATLVDYLHAAVAVPANLAARALTRGTRVEVQAPVRAPEMTLAQVRAGASRLLPGADIRRRLFWRYTLLYRRPEPVGADAYPGRHGFRY